jgi:hypothetical protein
MVASLAVGGALLLAMIAASGRAAATLASNARIPIHFGSAEHCYWASKRAGLVIWPVAGVLAFGVLGGVAASRLAAGWVPGVRDVITPAVLCVLLGFQVGALALARRGPGGAGVPGSDTTARSE